MRVLYFSTGYGLHDRKFLSALAKTEHQIFFLRLLTPEDRAVEVQALPAGVQWAKWKGAGTMFHWAEVPRLVVEFKSVIRGINPDVIHAGPIQSCAFIAAASGARPLLTMSWGFDLMQDADRSAWWRWVTRYTLRRSTYFVSDAEVTRAKAIRMGINFDRTAVFPWGVDLKAFAPHVAGDRESRGSQRRVFTILCNRSWEPRYGVDVLARAFVEAARSVPDVRLHLLGGGSQADLIRKILVDGKAIDRVHFEGYVPQQLLPRHYRQADLFVSPSHVDGSSVSLMEALACGTPVLVSDIPANKEWIVNGTNGWLFRDGDVDNLTQQIVWIARHRRNLDRIGKAGRKVAEERADWSSNFKELLRAYDRASLLGAQLVR